MKFEYRIVDVFTQTALEGNGLAVFLDGSGLSDPQMQKIAREMNLSETVFLFKPTRSDCVAKLRIFTPFSEMPFAGHPTVGTSYVLRSIGTASDQPNFSLEENVGPVKVRADDDGSFWLTTPPINAGKAYERAACAKALGLQEKDLAADIPCQVYSAGNPFLFVTVRDKNFVDNATPDLASILSLNSDKASTGIFVFAAINGGAYSRMFVPEHGVWEDPATGSATGPLAAFMMDHGLVSSRDGTRFASEQGVKMGRRSLLHVLVHGERGSEGIEVGGHVVPTASGTLTL